MTDPTTMPALFDAQVARSPDAPAILFEGEMLSYAQVASRANRLARHLIGLGAGSERIVALAMPRSAQTVIAMLAVLKAGAAYLPLDLDSPARMGRVLTDADPVAVLATGGAEALLPRQLLAPVVVLDTAATAAVVDALDATTVGDGERVSALTTQNAAYVLYTSGSTGTPKGVMVPHSGIINTLRWWQDDHPLTERDRVLLKTPLTFDPSIHEWFWPLWVGGVLVVARADGHKDTEYLISLIQEAGVTSVQFVPATLHDFLTHPAAPDCRSLRHVLCGGQGLPTSLVDLFFAVMPVGLLNLYGPTEASIESTSWQCRPGLPPGIAPIGRPIANSRSYVLDDALQPVPPDTTGELYIAGAGLARGYLGRPDLTALAFIANPFDGPGERMYRTGDLAFRTDDGNLQFVGRVDSQVKVNGVRIELGEIETALRLVTGADEVAVLVRGEDAQQHLFAFLACLPGGADKAPADRAAGVRSQLLELLPAAAVPSRIIFLDKLPAASNGKLDSAALADLAASKSASRDAAAYVGPQAGYEQRLAAIWETTLGSGRIGRDDNFFALGGTSLLAMRLIGQIRSAFGVPIPIRKLYETQTVAGLARELAALSNDPTNATGRPESQRHPADV
jgi:amino acid adenylation domain-containing protein